MFCKHDWEIVDKTILASAYEQLAEKAKSLTDVPGNPDLFQKTLHLVVKCKTCGALRRFTERNPIRES